MGLDDAEISEARQGVLGEDYQTELPEFTDAEPESPLDFLDRSEDDAERCDPEQDPNCEASEAAGHEPDHNHDEGAAGGEDGATGDGSSPTTEKNFWDHEADQDPPEPPEPPDLDLPEGLLTVLQVLGITVLVVIVLLIVWRIALAFSNRSETAEHVDKEGASDTGGALRSNAPTAPHSELAAQDHYDEAIHRLLLEVIDVISERQRGLNSPSLTSRELLRRVRLDDEPHGHLTALVRAVEEILFAKRSADSEKYQACLDHFSKIMRALGRGGV
ncbi:MAG: DUF4129 domain-containing protein [Myxococcota bacterium]